jgi:proteasome lid subunit RPN8/RPN11
MAKGKKPERLRLHIGADVAREIRQHARSQSKTEVCGVLLGSESDGLTSIEACIAGENAAQGGAHVTFTQDTWEHIYKVKDRDYPDARIVGWYHSHPGFGVFLSDHDTFIHKNFFSSPQQVAWVYDPHSDEEGCFGWEGNRLRRLGRIDFVDSRGGELAGGSDRPERISVASEDTDDEQGARTWVAGSRKPVEDPGDGEEAEVSRLAEIVFSVFSYLSVFLIGAILSWYFFQRTVYVAVDPYTGKVMGVIQELPPEKTAPAAPTPVQPAQPQSQPQPSKPQREDGHKQ